MPQDYLGYEIKPDNWIYYGRRQGDGSAQDIYYVLSIKDTGRLTVISIQPSRTGKYPADARINAARKVTLDPGGVLVVPAERIPDDMKRLAENFILARGR